MAYKSNLNPQFRSKFAEDIFNQKYRHEGAETWSELSATLADDVCGGLVSPSIVADIARMIEEMKFIPGGRYLYYCFDPATKILRSDYTWDDAENIKVGDMLVGFDERIIKSRFKDTTVTHTARITKPRYKITTNLGEVIVSDCHMFLAKSKLKPKKIGQGYQWIEARELVPGNIIAFSNKPWEVDTSFEAGWLSGILDGEGTVSKGSISVSQKPGLVLDKIVEILTRKGINFYVRGRDTDIVKTVYIRGRWESVKVLGMFRPIRLLHNWYNQGLGAFWSRINPPAVVEKVEYIGEGDVIVIETSEKTLIGNGFLSHNCGRPNKFYNNCGLIRCEEDTREDWALTSWKAERFLVTGAGIGVDYSIYRPRGSSLSRTGGQASGPVSKMRMINEIGREVMQGGSRRSAIYASLNWQHQDAPEFLTAKDWHNMPVGQTGLSIWDLKQQDFNYPAPLDMTNISLNYDDTWLSKPDRHLDPTFLKNVSQALRTGEPGFSFNFGPRQNETLRNAPLSGDTRVLTSLGYRAISNLVEINGVIVEKGIVNTPVNVWTGKQWAITTFKKTASNAPIVNVRYTTGTIKAEPSHPFLVHGKGRVPAGELVPGDQLVESLTEGYEKVRPPIYVISVTPGEPEDVYCCDVGVEEHCFMAEGVLVSNCTEVVSEDDSDICNLGSINMSRIETLAEFHTCVELATIFLLCGTLRAELPYEKVYTIREKNRRLGLGLMGIHEWLLQRGYKYEMNPELRDWLRMYKAISSTTAAVWSHQLSCSTPVATRAIAPTGSIGILAGTTTGIEPLFAVAYKRRYLKGTTWHYQYVVDSAAQELIDRYGLDPESIETALDLAPDFERRLAFQADIQDYVDMAISSTINLPAWHTPHNNEDLIVPFAETLSRYAPRLRGFTVYPDGARGGQPLESVPYKEAQALVGEVFMENHDICSISGKGGSCGV